jgi:hypothetical protein
MQKSWRGETPTNSLTATHEGEALKARRKAVISLLERRQLDKGMAPLEDRILVATAVSWEKHLTNFGVPHGRYDEVYEDAVNHYKDEAPFSVHDMLAAWRRIRERENYDRKYPQVSECPALPAPKLRNCPLCRGTKIKMVEGRAQYVTVDGQRQVERCQDCSE